MVGPGDRDGGRYKPSGREGKGKGKTLRLLAVKNRMRDSAHWSFYGNVERSIEELGAGRQGENCRGERSLGQLEVLVLQVPTMKKKIVDAQKAQSNRRNLESSGRQGEGPFA